MDYALFILLAVYGAYALIARSNAPRRQGWAWVVVPLLAAIVFYTALKYAFIEAGIQPR